ncbi:hypothetical protein yc1106_09356 [Curvularia clavata]|uniref:Uncharacterized protein n=1 Tax=Curvularia clavata TaxID=95742 RepID=A0A9Q8ZHJ2_CURCL|nr:hypothetical protein yc1106_09356 [Curvularia clavata]
MPTKSTLTYVVTSTASPSSGKSVATTTPTITSDQHTQTSSTQSAFVDTVSSFPSPTSSATPTSAPVTTAADDKPRMTPAQIAGLSVAAVAAFVLAIGLMALSVWLRRRKEQRNTMLFDDKDRRQHDKKFSTRFSRYLPMQDSPEPVKQLPPMPEPALGPGRRQKGGRLKQRLGVGTSNGSSNSSLPLDQIGVAISAELDGNPLAPKKPAPAATQPTLPGSKQPQANNSLRPYSTMTEETVFEEDEVVSRRGSSTFPPAPPVPVPPIRSLQPTRTATNSNNTSAQGSSRGSELFLSMPVQQGRVEPKQVATAELPSNSASQPRQQPAQRPRLASPFQMSSTMNSYESKATTPSSRDDGSSGDIIDYYFSSQPSRAAPKASPTRIIRPKESPRTIEIKPKKSSSTISRTWTNQRDSLSSQTSFETVDPDDPTPEDEDDQKQLSDDSSNNKPPLSPVAESPISKLRYPKVPRASNQLVSRSPPQHRFQSPHRVPDASSLLQKRNNALPPLLLESRPRLESPHRDPFTSPPRRVVSPPHRNGRSHVRSVSAESWSTTPASKNGFERKSRVQSGTWGKSPVMYEEQVVRPLNVRKREDMKEVNIGRDVDVDFGADGLKSPVWIPRLTPRKKGEDLFLEVGWGDGVRR